MSKIIKDNPEEIPGFENYYNSIKNDHNNLSYWFPKIEKCKINVPKTVILPVPMDIMLCFFMERKTDMDTVYRWVQETVIPFLKEKDMQGLLFMKNGAFSNKFDFKDCIVASDNALMLANSIININYTSLMFDTSGNAELVFRERISTDYSKTPTIYNGMPLRNEYRIFYDFNNHKALYIVNYWDIDYCNASICRNATDKIVYEHVYPDLFDHYCKNKDCVFGHVSNILKDVHGLEGIWSVDVLEDEQGNFWLIDMAIAQQSAYWDPTKIEEGNNETE